MNRILLVASTAILIAGGVATAEAANLAAPVEQDSQAMKAADHIGPTTSIRDQIQSQLSKDGYTDIQIMPSSFMVRAKSKMGNPVEMVIGPDSFTEVTEVAQKTTAAPSTATAAPAMSGATAPKPAPKS